MAKEQVQNEVETMAQPVSEQSEYLFTRDENNRPKATVHNGITIIPDLEIVREAYTVKNNDTEFFQYKVSGKFLGKIVTVDLVAGKFGAGNELYTDREVYDILNFAFTSLPELRFGIKVEETDRSRKISFFVLGLLNGKVKSVVPVVISRPSSKAKLEMLLSEVSEKHDGMILPSVF